MGSIPGGEGISEALAKLVTGGLGDEGHGHLTKADVEVQGTGTFPAQGLIGIEEFLDMPALRVVDGQVENLVTVACSQKGFIVEILGNFSGALHELAVGGFGVLLEVERTMRGGPSRPAWMKLLRRDGLERSR